MIESDLYRMKTLFPNEMAIVEDSENCGSRRQIHCPILKPTDRQPVLLYCICHDSVARVRDLERTKPISGHDAGEGFRAYSLKIPADFRERHYNEGVH